MDGIEILGFVAAFFTTISSIPQLIKMIITKSATDVSSFMFFCLLIGGILWFSYGLMLSSKPLLVANFITTCFVVANLTFKYKYNK
jgi:MtN3 and saliva related transmembrane protein